MCFRFQPKKKIGRVDRNNLFFYFFLLSTWAVQGSLMNFLYIYNVDGV